MELVLGYFISVLLIEMVEKELELDGHLALATFDVSMADIRSLWRCCWGYFNSASCIEMSENELGLDGYLAFATWG